MYYNDKDRIEFLTLSSVAKSSLEASTTACSESFSFETAYQFSDIVLL